MWSLPGSFIDTLWGAMLEDPAASSLRLGATCTSEEAPSPKVLDPWTSIELKDQWE